MTCSGGDGRLLSKTAELIALIGLEFVLMDATLAQFLTSYAALDAHSTMSVSKFVAASPCGRKTLGTFRVHEGRPPQRACALCSASICQSR